MIPKIPINYYPLLNSGHTLMMDGKLDPGRMYYNKAIYAAQEIFLFSEFEELPTAFYSHNFIFLVNGNIDYNVLTSLN